VKLALVSLGVLSFNYGITGAVDNIYNNQLTNKNFQFFALSFTIIIMQSQPCIIMIVSLRMKFADLSNFVTLAYAYKIFHKINRLPVWMVKTGFIGRNFHNRAQTLTETS